MHKKTSTQKGFTLIELMVVIVIVGVLAAIIYPNYMKFSRNARLQNAKADLVLAQNMLEKYYAQNHSFRNGNDYPTAVLSNIDNEYFNIDFYSSDNDASNLVCAPATLSSDQYCLYAAPKNNNAEEERFVFVDATGIMQVCQIGGANISDDGALTNKHNAVSCQSM